jgi:hypothetical protein
MNSLKNDARPWIPKQWYIPRIDAEFLYRMVCERTLEVGEGKVCVDERSYLLRAGTRPSLPMKPQRPARQDSPLRVRGPATCIRPLPMPVG